jgi:hypothetical protein
MLYVVYSREDSIKCAYLEDVEAPRKLKDITKILDRIEKAYPQYIEENVVLINWKELEDS